MVLLHLLALKDSKVTLKIWSKCVHDISKKTIGDNSMDQMLIHLKWILLLLKLHLLLHHHMVLVISVHGCLDKILVEIMMEVMLRSRNFQMNFPSPLLVMDDKGGEDVKD